MGGFILLALLGKPYDTPCTLGYWRIAWVKAKDGIDSRPGEFLELPFVL
jgi:hypothetical protein